MHVRLIPHSPSGPRHLLAHYPPVSCILALLAIYTDARAYRPSASLLAFLPSPEGVAVTDTGFKTHNARATTAHQTPPFGLLLEF